MGSGVLILNSQGKVLVLHRNKNVRQGNLWGMPGGKILKGQKAIDVALSKTKDEIGLDLKQENLNFLDKFQIDAEGRIITFYVWITYLDSLGVTIKLNTDGHDKYTWESPETLLDKPDLMKGMYPILKRYIQTKKPI